MNNDQVREHLKYIRIKSAHICKRCRSSLPKDYNYVLCERCRSEASRNNKSRYKMLRESGMCVSCGCSSENSARCESCQSKRNKYSRMQYKQNCINKFSKPE